MVWLLSYHLLTFGLWFAIACIVSCLGFFPKFASLDTAAHCHE